MDLSLRLQQEIVQHVFEFEMAEDFFPAKAAAKAATILETVTASMLGVNMRASVLDCGSPLPLSVARPGVEKRQRAAALQDLTEIPARFRQSATANILKPHLPPDQWGKCLCRLLSVLIARTAVLGH
jgi:hypothetical protein